MIGRVLRTHVDGSAPRRSGSRIPLSDPDPVAVRRMRLPRRPMGPGAARVSALLMVHNVALTLGAPWLPYAQMVPRGGLTSIHAMGALLWAVVALAFLARGGTGPLRRAPRALITAICWFAVLSSVFSIPTTQQAATGWGVAAVGMNAALAVAGVIALRLTRPGLPEDRPTTGA